MAEQIPATLVLRLPSGDEEAELVCPRCGERNLHHGDVTVRNRFGEDMHGTLTRVDNKGACHIEPVSGQDFPSRRGSVSIEFSCEHCEGPLHLEIVQHKGMTFLSWRMT